MWNQLSKRDQRAVLLGAAAGVIILAYTLAGPWLEDWQQIRAQLAQKQQQLASVGLNEDGRLSVSQAAMLATVPKFEMPKPEKEQAVLFRDEFIKQLNKANVKARSMQYLASRQTTTTAGYKTLRLQCQGRCNLDQMLGLLGELNANPYLAGIEEIKIEPDQKNRNDIDYTLTVSTFAR